MTGCGVEAVGVAWRNREGTQMNTAVDTQSSHKPLATALELRFLLGETHFALAVYQSALEGCDFPRLFVEFAVAVDRFEVVVVGFWSAAIEPVTVCWHHIHHLAPQLWPLPATPSLAGYPVALSSCSSGTAESSGPGDAPPGIASSPPSCSCNDAPTLFDPPSSHCRPCKQLPGVWERSGRE